MLNFGDIVNTVQQNCHISDARHAGNYSMCIFLLKMREYYRWEHDIPLTRSLPQKAIGDWLIQRERVWERIESDEYRPLPLASTAVDPFDTANINTELLSNGYVYSGGFGLFHKPHFFVGQLLRREHREGITVLVSSCEYARDLVAPPAMMLDDTIYVRQESVRRLLWEKLEEWRWNKRPDTPMARAVAGHGGDADIGDLLERMTEAETETMILHEIGEIQAGRLLGAQWEEMLAGFACTKAEHVLRAVRDHLADCLSTLPALLEQRRHASLHFYFANLTGLRKALFPAATEAYERWRADGSLMPLKDVVHAGATYWQQTARGVLDLYREKGQTAGDAIVNLLEDGAGAGRQLAG